MLLGANHNKALGDESACSWCEGGDATCDWSYSDFEFTGFTTSVSASVDGRVMPYVKPTPQAALGVADNDVTCVRGKTLAKLNLPIPQP